jgi:hypothetical protein
LRDGGDDNGDHHTITADLSSSSSSDEESRDPAVVRVKKKREAARKAKRKRRANEARVKDEKAKRRKEWARREGRISSVHRSSWLVKAVILACISLLSVGSYFAYDSIAALETYIKEVRYRAHPLRRTRSRTHVRLIVALWHLSLCVRACVLRRVQDLSLSSFRFGLLYSSYAIPNIGTLSPPPQ